jgi:pteridine reductase
MSFLDHDDLRGKNILITGAARRVGRALALAITSRGAKLILHHGHSPQEAEETKSAILNAGGSVHVLQADFEDPRQARELIFRATEFGPLYALVNNAAIFEALSLSNTTLESWNRHLNINLTSPFLLSQAFAEALPHKSQGRIINILDWRASRPGGDHLPYTISKAALAALTSSLAISLAPKITVNGLALGAILPPSSGEATLGVLEDVPAGRWAALEEVCQSLLFLLTGPAYITGEIIHVDGGRHLI